MKIIVMGGSFSPVHNSHIEVGDKLTQYADEVWFMPCFKSRWGKTLVDGKHRINMLQICIDKLHNPKLKVSDWEIKNEMSGSSYELMTSLKNTFPNDQLILALGRDNIDKFSSFKRFEDIRNEFPIYVVDRSEYVAQPIDKDWFQVHPHKELFLNVKGCSSTEIRDYLYGKTFDESRIQQFLDKDVRQYIIEHELYKPD